MSEPQGKKNFVFAAIMGILGGYAASAVIGYPQLGTKLTNSQHDAVVLPEPATSRAHAQEMIAAATPDHGPKFHPPYYMVLPFCLLLAAIAIFPLMHATEHFWESNL